MGSFEGVFIPVTTPFRGDVAAGGLAANLERWDATALAGYKEVLATAGLF